MNRLQTPGLALLGGVSLGLFAACALLPTCSASESRLLPATTSWVGNSFGGGKTWVQQDIQAMVVTEDGTVYCNVPWDEAGREVGIYRDGNVTGFGRFFKKFWWVFWRIWREFGILSFSLCCNHLVSREL